jgi:hypothetical protein
VNQPDHRVSVALGSMGHVLLATVGQNVCILIALSSILNKELAAFCNFAALSLVVDLLFFWSFFIAVLTLDLKRHGMLDSVEIAPQRSTQRNESSMKQHRISRLQRTSARQQQQTIFHHPRIIGTVAIVVFIFILALHYPQQIPLDFRPRLAMSCGPALAHGKPSGQLSPRAVHRADSTTWLATQASHTLREILRLAGTGSTSFVARVYNPVVVMPRSVSGNIPRQQCMSQLPPSDGYIRLPLVLMVCSVLILMISNCFTHPTQRVEDSSIEKPGSITSVRYLPQGHSLDVYLLSASRKPYLASVGFDHDIRYWDLESRERAGTPITLSAMHDIWPATAIAVDDKGEWVAVCSRSGDIGVQRFRQRTGRTISTGLASQTVLCSFLPCLHIGGLLSAPSLLIVSTDGLLVHVAIETGNVTSHRICGKQIRSAHLDSIRPLLPRLVSTTEDNEIYTTIRREGLWVTQPLHVTPFLSPQPAHLRFTTLPDLRMIGLAFDSHTSQLYLIDFLSCQY